jgi:four helix bundle protein
MYGDDLKKRLQLFAIRILNMVEKLPNTYAGRAIAGQVSRSGTSPGANYRAARLGKSTKDFINKLKIVEEELDETLYWLEIITIQKLIKPELLEDLMKENQELLAIIISSIKTARNNLN